MKIKLEINFKKTESTTTDQVKCNIEIYNKPINQVLEFVYQAPYYRIGHG